MYKNRESFIEGIGGNPNTSTANNASPSSDPSTSAYQKEIASKKLDINNPKDWQDVWSTVKNYKSSMNFINFRGNVQAMSKSFSGCIGTDEDGKPLIVPDGDTCDLNNMSDKMCKLENLHTPDTCKLNAGMVDSEKNFKYLNSNGKNSSKYIPGLKFTVFNGSMRDRYDNFFTSNPTKILSGVSTEFGNLGEQTHNVIIENVGHGQSSKGRGTDTHNFTIEWTGFFKPPAVGSYTFSIESDDSSILWLGDSANNARFSGNERNVFIDNAGGHGMYTKTNTLTVNDGNFYPIRLRFEEGGGGYGMIFIITDSKGTNVTSASLFNINTDLLTYYSMIRSGQNKNLYDCYILGSDYKIEKSKGKKYVYRDLLIFPYKKNDGQLVSSTQNMYLAVGDDGTLQIYDAKKNIDFDKQESRDEFHKEFICRVNGLFPDTPNIQYCIQADGQLKGINNGNWNDNKYLSWQNSLGLDGGSDLYKTLNNKGEGGIVQAAFSASPFDYTYDSTLRLCNRNIIVHKNNPYNTKKMHYAIISDGGNYKFRMTEQGQAKLIYAVDACQTVNNGGDIITYTQADQNSFAFYNVNADPKTNKSFLYDPEQKTLDYIDPNKYNNLYTYNSNKPDYTEYKDIYIPTSFKTSNKSGNYTNATLETCKKACDSAATCGYYYHTSLSDGTDQCYTDKSSGTTHYQFTPSDVTDGSLPSFVNKNPSSLYIKEKTVLISSNLTTDSDINKVVVDYTDTNYTNAKIHYDSYSFGQKFGDTTKYEDPDLKKVVSNELQYYGYDANLINQRNTPAGLEDTFISGGGREGFVEGLEIVSLTSDTMGSGDQNTENTDTNTVPSIGTAPGTIGNITVGETDGSTESKNANSFISYSPPAAIALKPTDTKNKGFFETVMYHMASVTIHLPFYKLENFKDSAGNMVVGCKNRGFYKKNYDDNGNCLTPNSFKIILTQDDSPTPLYNAIYQGSDGNSIQKTVDTTKDVSLPFSNNYIQLTGQTNQYFIIPNKIEYPQNNVCFSFYFKVSGNCKQWARVFDFGNGQHKNNVMAYFHNDNGQISLGFKCFGTGVYGQTERELPSVNAKGDDFFENVQDKWHYCEWYMQRYNIENPNYINGYTQAEDKKNGYSTSQSISESVRYGVQIVWWLCLHTLENDKTVSRKFYILLDSTFSNYRDAAEKDADDKRRQTNPDTYRGRWLYGGNNDKTPWKHGESHYISRGAPKLQGQINEIDQTRDYVDGYDCICIKFSFNDVGWTGGGFDNKLRPYQFTTLLQRLSFPTVPTTQNYIGASPWNDPMLYASIRDFKMISQQSKFFVVSIPGAFGWCVDNLEDAWWGSHGLWVGTGANAYFKIIWPSAKWVNGGPFEDWQIYKWQPIVDDNNAGFLSNLAYKAVNNASTYKPGFMSPTGSLSTSYDPNFTSNLANFIYSQIIYNDSESRKMLKPYLQTMATYKPNGVEESFSNIENFTGGSSYGSSNKEGFYPMTDNAGLPLRDNMRYNANILNSQTIDYESRFVKLSDNSKELKSYLDNHDGIINSVQNDNVGGTDDFYDFSGNHLLYYDSKEIPTLRDTKISDNQQFIIQQNTVYIIGTITCATMIIAAIILGRQ